MRTRTTARGTTSGRCLAQFALLAVLVFNSGCWLQTLKKELHKGGELAALEGHAEGRGAEHAPVVVVVYSVTTQKVADLFLLPRPGPFFFALAAGTYQLAAFEDRNHDLSYQPGEEPAALFNDGAALVLQPGEHRAGVRIGIDPASGARLPFAVSALASGRRDITQLPAPQLGTVVKIDDPRFSDENGKLGLWEPLRFLFEVGAGVYFLEPYDPHKIPILFVHGAMGHPGNWKYLVGTLDRTRFQPWFAYYPMALPLDRLGRGLVRTIAALQVKYGFSQLVLVAHSMGGLVTRAALNYTMHNYTMHNAGTGRIVRLPAFVSISSPWNGHSAAAVGAKYSPVVAPSWKDMTPGSRFLSRLPQTALPPECEHSLLFSYRGNVGVGGEANDGTVAVSSELPMPIQRQAAHVIGFNESHDGILESSAVAEELNAILTRVTARKQ